jgi:hypothetical protein
VNYAELWQTIQDYTQNYETDFVANIPVFVTQAEERVYNTVQLPPLRKNVTGTSQPNSPYLTCPTDFLSVFSMAVIDATGTYEFLLNKDVNFLRAAYPSPTDTGTPKYYALFGPEVLNRGTTNELSFIMAPTPDARYSIELHYYYYPVSIVQGIIRLLGTIAGGSGYTNGSYYRVPLTGGTGSGASADIIVSGGSITAVTLRSGGSFYTVADSLTASTTILGAGSGFSVPVQTLINADGSSWLGDNYSPALLYGALVEAYIFMKGEQDMMTYYETKFKEALGQLNRLGTGLERGDAYRDGQARIKVTQ